MLKIKNVDKYYGDNHVLKNINLEVNKNDVIGIIGGSGSGKSTFLRTIARIDDVTNGEILFNSTNIKHIENYHERIGMVFQKLNLFPHLTVLDNITIVPIKIKLMSKTEAVKRARELIKSFIKKYKKAYSML